MLSDRLIKIFQRKNLINSLDMSIWKQYFNNTAFGHKHYFSSCKKKKPFNNSLKTFS